MTTELPPPVLSWPTPAQERVMLMAATNESPAHQQLIRSLVHRIRELEGVIERRAFLDDLAKKYPVVSAAPPLTKSQVEAAAEKLFSNGSRCWPDGYLVIFGNAMDGVRTATDRSLADVVHLLCENLGVRE